MRTYLANPDLRNELERNALLAGLPDSEREIMLEHLRPAVLKLGTQVHEQDVRIDKVYFPLNGIFSILTQTSDGDQIETALVGSDGVVGSYVASGLPRALNVAIVQAPVTALTIGPPLFAEVMKTCPTLRTRVERFHAYLLLQAQHNSVCNLLHAVEARLCRWVLQFRDRADGDTFALTQDFIARMLGVTRPTLNLALSQLRNAGMVRTHRGAVEILDRDGIEASACECYETLRRRRTEVLLLKDDDATPRK